MAQRIYVGRLIYGLRPETFEKIWMVVTNLSSPDQAREYIEIEEGDHLQIFHYHGLSLPPTKVFDGRVGKINMKAVEAIPVGCNKPFIHLLTSRAIQFKAEIIKESESFFTSFFSQE